MVLPVSDPQPDAADVEASKDYLATLDVDRNGYVNVPVYSLASLLQAARRRERETIIAAGERYIQSIALRYPFPPVYPISDFLKTLEEK